jgi:hypothetical protein
MATTITLDQLHDLFSEAYAVCVNDTLYFVGYDAETDVPYTADNDGDDYVEYDSIDGDIEMEESDCYGSGNAVFFFKEGQPFRIVFLSIMQIKE